MAWTKIQKQLAVRACKEAGISDEQRRDMVLRNFENAHYRGCITSTSPKLNNRDFAHFMAIMESAAGGKILHFTKHYWGDTASDQLHSMRHRVMQLASILETNGKLMPNRVGLAGWIRNRVCGGIPLSLEELDLRAVQALIIGLTAYARQNGISLPSEWGSKSKVNRKGASHVEAQPAHG